MNKTLNNKINQTELKVQENRSTQPDLYIPELESDACGIGLITQYKGEKSHKLVDDALTMLERMQHRGACGCEPDSGDGAGISLQMPHSFFAGICQKKSFDLPEFWSLRCSKCFLS